MSRLLTREEIDEHMKLKDDDITKELFIRWYGITEEKLKPKYSTNDWFILKKSMSKWYTENTSITTTSGRFLFNIFLNYSIFGNTFAYFNDEDASKFHKQVSYAFIQGVVTREQHSMYQTKKAWLEYTPTEILVPGMSFNMMRVQPQVAKRRAELFKIYEEELNKGGTDAVNAAVKIEAELLALAKEITKDDPASRLFRLKKPSFGNNYKNMSVMIGSQRDNTNPSVYHVSKSNYTDGIDKNEFSSHADQLIYGTYQRSVNTQEGGAQTKEITAAFENEQVNIDPNSDCKTPFYITVDLTDDNIDLYLFRFIIGPKGLIEILPDNKKDFVGKRWKMRSPLYCNDPDYCDKCTGSLYRRLNIKDAGITLSGLGSVIVGLSMKAFHDLSVKTQDMNWEDFFSD